VDFLFGDGCLNIQMQEKKLLQNPLKQGQKNFKEKKKEIQKFQVLNKQLRIVHMSKHPIHVQIAENFLCLVERVILVSSISFNSMMICIEWSRASSSSSSSLIQISNVV
jgi:hypothetical protein